MKKQRIAVIDSGFGGISVLKQLVKNFPHEQFVYFGDNDNAPYGNLSRLNLWRITINNIDMIKRYNVKAIVLACNTLSVNLFNQIKEFSSLPTFCIFPPVERCQIGGGRTLLLATERTARNYNVSPNFDLLGLKDLAFIIEKNIFNLNSFDFDTYFDNIDKFKQKKVFYENVILGCTHYNFIKNKILIHFRPQNLYDGTENLVKAMKKYCNIQKSSVKNKEFKVLFIGRNARLNEHIYNVSGQCMQF